MSMNVENCPRCGRIFIKGFNDVCPNCVKEIDLQYEECVKCLRQNKGTTINELNEATGVSIKQITKFIREGRISLLHAPNMSYPCDVCGTLIRENLMCESCRMKLVKDVNNSREDKERSERTEQGTKVSFKIEDRLRDRR